MSEAKADALIVARVQRGDKAAFDLLVLKYQHRITGLVARYVRDPHEAQDVVQEAFIKAYKALPRFRGDAAFYTWLYRIAVNTAKNYLVAQGRRPPQTGIETELAENLPDGDSLRELASPEHIMLRNEIGQAVMKAMAALPEDLSTAISLREIDGMSYEEIAEVMECPIGTVRSRIFRAREAIDRVLAPLLERE